MEDWIRANLDVHSDAEGELVHLERTEHGTNCIPLGSLVHTFAGPYPDPARMLAAGEKVGLGRHVRRWIEEGLL